jgi:hypothetical protein
VEGEGEELHTLMAKSLDSSLKTVEKRKNRFRVSLLIKRLLMFAGVRIAMNINRGRELEVFFLNY